MDYIDIYDDKGNKKQMQVVSIFELEGKNYHYIVYKELDNSKTYLAKYKDNKTDLDTNISDEELLLCEAILNGVIN